MNVEILCVGTEILLGDIVNTNAAYLSKELALCGFNCYYQTVVGDNPQRLKEVLALSLSRSDMVIMTGGLGPTYDDLTKETVAEFFGREMELHEPSLKSMTCFFHKVGRPMTDNNKKQAYMPKGAVVFPNEAGTAPGLAVEGQLEGSEKIAIMLPGPPREMTSMFQSQVLPYLQKKAKTTLVSHTVHMFGIGESAMEERLRETMVNNTNPTAAPYAKEGEVLVRVTASGANFEEANRLAQPMIEEICGVFPEYVYGVDVQTLQNALVQRLMEKKLTVATAESCTGGWVSKRITEVSGSSQVFGCGICAYENAIKEKVLGVSAQALADHGAVSQETALEMARGVRALAGADIGLSTTGVAGPEGGTEEKPVGLVYIAVSCDKLETVVELRLSRGYKQEREIIRNLASSNVLHLGWKAAGLY
ncbi:competence/damage-inducible protein A [Oscillospiraceae bacterium MB08-C2-2]|nr:competence/damage-inducible protein A [Oscillospiraceae bacterium MB08-C2-2]